MLRQIKKEELSTRVVLLTGVTDEEAMLEAIHLGVCGVVLKDTPPELVLQYVRAVHARGQWLERRSISQPLERLLQLETQRRQSKSGLTPRQLEIVRLGCVDLPDLAPSFCRRCGVGWRRTPLSRIIVVVF